MKKILFLVFWLWTSAAFAQFTQTPNLGLDLVPFGYARWDIPMNANSTKLDTLVPTLDLSCGDGDTPIWGTGKFSICGNSRTVTARYIISTLPVAPKVNEVFVVTDAVADCTKGGGNAIIQCQWNGKSYDAISGIGGAPALGPDLTALEANSTAGFWAAATNVVRSMATADTNNITITNPAGILGNPTWAIGPNVALTTRSFTAAPGANIDFNLLSARSFTLPNATGAAPTTPGTLAFDLTSQALKLGLTNGSTVTLATGGTAQPLNANLTAFSNQTGAANRFSYWTAAATLGLGILPAAPCNAGEALTFNSVSPYTMICTATTGISGGVLNTFALFSGATAITASGSLLSQSGGNVLVNGGLVLGNCGTDCINHITSAYTGHGAISLTWPYVGGAANLMLSTGALTTGHILTVGANGQAVDGGAAGTGTWTDSSVSVGDHKTLIDALAGGGTSNIIQTQFVAYWDAASLTVDGTQCAEPTKVTINTGPLSYVVVCADNAGSIFEGSIVLKQAVTTMTFSLIVSDVDSSSQHFAGGFKAMCRTGAAIDNTWGTSQPIDITMVTANLPYTGTTAAVTANGTCSAGAILFWRFTMDAATNTDDGDARVLGVLLKQIS